MRTLSGSQIREDFLRFFEGKWHRRVHSSSLVPHNDPTLLFTNAGMNQFKDVFLGAEQRAYTRAASSQKCVRAGGKHNDLENVGFTRRHHTFFEMLGNFSFGDYFKREAIAYAWELLTSPEWFGIDPGRLYVTVFAGDESVPRDDEAEGFWVETGVPRERIFAMGAKDNFWQMGETGPCGPCSEIFFDLGVAASESGEDRPFPEDDQRYVEIWNLVFMQFDRTVTPEGPYLAPLPKPSIDTGMGLERIACVLQSVLSNYQTDLFLPLLRRAEELVEYDDGTVGSVTADPSSFDVSKVAAKQERAEASIRIIADHARAATFLIADGVRPENEGRGYVLRKILRRAIRHGRNLGQEKPFMHQMVYAVRDEMQTAYPELTEAADRISKTVLAEEEQFARTLVLGSQHLSSAIRDAQTRAWTSALERIVTESKSGPKPLLRFGEKEPFLSTRASFHDLVPRFSDFHSQVSFFTTFRSVAAGSPPEEGSVCHYFIQRFDRQNARDAMYLLASFFDEELPKQALPGERAFHIFETYGLPLDFMIDAARDAGIRFDLEGFEKAKAEEQARARASWKGGSQQSVNPLFTEFPKTEFEGYSALRLDGARVIAIIDLLGGKTPTVEAGQYADIILDATSFYADSGGQQGDIGYLLGPDHHTRVAEVRGVRKLVQGVFAHKVRALQPIALGDELDTAVDPANRHATERNHTGTHLLHAALRQVLGPHVKQAGSLVNQSRLRFDFSHFAPVADAELQEIEDIVNREVLANAHVETLVDVPIDEAIRDLGAMALFGEKYGERVRVVRIGDFSTELCGGTHTRATGEIGLLKLVGESSVASGVRRIEALSGTGALEEFRRDFEVARVAGQFTGGSEGAPAEALRARLTAADEEMKKLRRELDQARMKAANSSVADAAASAVTVKGVKVLAQRVDGLDKGQMRTLVDTLRGKLGSGVVVLGAADREAGRVTLIAGVTKDLTGKVQAGKLVGLLAAMVGGKGGGRPDLAEAGGTEMGKLDGALSGVAEVVSGLVG